jgi:hypothetical protein
MVQGLSHRLVTWITMNEKHRQTLGMNLYSINACVTVVYKVKVTQSGNYRVKVKVAWQKCNIQNASFATRHSTQRRMTRTARHKKAVGRPCRVSVERPRHCCELSTESNMLRKETIKSTTTTTMQSTANQSQPTTTTVMSPTSEDNEHKINVT